MGISAYIQNGSCGSSFKKPGLDQHVSVNYRPISNVHTVSKIIERLVLVRLKPHLLATENFYNSLQSAYRSGHSTKMALQRILNSLYKAIDGKTHSHDKSWHISCIWYNQSWQTFVAFQRWIGVGMVENRQLLALVMLDKPRHSHSTAGPGDARQATTFTFNCWPWWC